MRGTQSPKLVINEARRIPMSKSLHADFVIRYRMYLGAYRDMLFLIEWAVRLRRPAPNQLMKTTESNIVPSVGGWNSFQDNRPIVGSLEYIQSARHGSRSTGFYSESN